MHEIKSFSAVQDMLAVGCHPKHPAYFVTADGRPVTFAKAEENMDSIRLAFSGEDNGWLINEMKFASCSFHGCHLRLIEGGFYCPKCERFYPLDLVERKFDIDNPGELYVVVSERDTKNCGIGRAIVFEQYIDGDAASFENAKAFQKRLSDYGKTRVAKLCFIDE